MAGFRYPAITIIVAGDSVTTTSPTTTDAVSGVKAFDAFVRRPIPKQPPRLSSASLRLAALFVFGI